MAKVLGWIALILLIVGGINWALFGIFNINLVQLIFGSSKVLETVIYALVGLAGLYGFNFFKQIY